MVARPAQAQAGTATAITQGESSMSDNQPNSMPEDSEPQDSTENKLGRRSYDELIDDPSLTEEQLNAELNAYAKALADDLAKKNAQASDTEHVQNNTKEF